MSEIFSVEDPPDINDPNLSGVAKFLRVHLNDGSNFYKFGAELMPERDRTSVKDIELNATTALHKKCLELIELWIRSVEGRKWQDLVEAAKNSGFGGLATALATEFGSQREPPRQNESATNGGNYSSIISVC